MVNGHSLRHRSTIFDNDCLLTQHKQHDTQHTLKAQNWQNLSAEVTLKPQWNLVESPLGTLNSYHPGFEIPVPLCLPHHMGKNELRHWNDSNAQILRLPLSIFPRQSASIFFIISGRASSGVARACLPNLPLQPHLNHETPHFEVGTCNVKHTELFLETLDFQKKTCSKKELNACSYTASAWIEQLNVISCTHFRPHTLQHHGRLKIALQRTIPETVETFGTHGDWAPVQFQTAKSATSAKLVQHPSELGDWMAGWLIAQQRTAAACQSLSWKRCADDFQKWKVLEYARMWKVVVQKNRAWKINIKEKNRTWTLSEPNGRLLCGL